MALGPSSSEQPRRTHKIIDGDTLRALAERYLGDAGRYMEIYEANRLVLLKPEVLPIGVELGIPPRGSRGPSLPKEVWKQPLVPIPPSSLRRLRQPRTNLLPPGPGVTGVPARERSDPPDAA